MSVGASVGENREHFKTAYYFQTMIDRENLNEYLESSPSFALVYVMKMHFVLIKYHYFYLLHKNKPHNLSLGTFGKIL